MSTLQSSIFSLHCTHPLGQHSSAAAPLSSPCSVRNIDFSMFLRILVAPPLVAASFRRSHPSQTRFFQCRAALSPENNADSTRGSVDPDFLNSSVLEAVEVKHGSGGISIRTRDGSQLKCAPIDRRRRHPPPDYASQPTIFLKIEDGSNLLLPIFAMDWHTASLRQAMRNVYLARPTIYQALRDLIQIGGFRVKSVRVTKRLHDVYFAKLQLAKQKGDEVQEFHLDLLSSDAINIAIRCQAPIQVHRHLAYVDGVKIYNDRRKGIITELDRPESGRSMEAAEVVLLWSMMRAAMEERYADAARLRDELSRLRSNSGSKEV